MSVENYIVTEEKQALFDKLLDLLVVFDRVCKEHELKYFIAYGTLLGAIRHNGFIPWDDDVDVCMPREDYNRLKKVAAEGAFEFPYFFQDPSTDEGYPKGFSRIRNSLTAEIPFDDVAMKCNRGIFLDIFPIDNIPDDKELFRKQIKKMQLLRLFMNSYARYYSGYGSQNTTKVKKIAYHVSCVLFKTKILTMDRLYKKFDKTAQMYNGTKCKLCGTIASDFDDETVRFNTEWFEEGYVSHVFENTELMIPEFYDKMLKVTYGDYMKPVQAPSGHGELIYSTTVPYEQFFRENEEYLTKRWKQQTEVKDE